MTPGRRYVLLQLPGWALAAAICVLLWRAALLPGWAATAAVAAWIAKDALLYPLVRRAYEPAPPPLAGLIGARVVARQPLAPIGYVALQGQLWRAEVMPGEATPVERDETVWVHAIVGLTLRVRRTPDRT